VGFGGDAKFEPADVRSVYGGGDDYSEGRVGEKLEKGKIVIMGG